MKSKRAREIILKSKKDVEESKIQGDVAHIDANHAVRIAEQEAEERVLSVVAKWLKKTYHDYAVDEQFIPEIKNLLNNGEQSDE